MAAYGGDALVTTGVFALVRHPIYSSWIVLIFPGLALLCRSWPLLGASLAAYIVFKTSIGKEDEYLDRRFGSAYREYRSRVNEIIPFPRFRRR
jgi:protein-S-isoprenylcysteine O-methyltransferase Ste14